jgi:hypothetical protein
VLENTKVSVAPKTHSFKENIMSDTLPEEEFDMEKVNSLENFHIPTDVEHELLCRLVESGPARYLFIPPSHNVIDKVALDGLVNHGYAVQIVMEGKISCYAATIAAFNYYMGFYGGNSFEQAKKNREVK